MVRINLAKKGVSKKPDVPRFHVPVRLIAVVMVAATAAAAVVVGIRYLPKVRPGKTGVPVAKAPTPFTPSTYKKTDIVEDVVREIASERAAGVNKQVLDLPYEELSFLEKVNYEVLFGKNVFELLSRAVPQGIGLRSLEVDNFQTVYAVGLGASRDLVSSTFIALKSEKLELLPQPLSYITSNNGEGYRFVVTCKTKFGLDLTDPFQASDHLPVRDDLPLLTKKITGIGEDAGVKWRGGPLQLTAEKIGAYRRFHYRYRGTATYNEFVKFLLDLYGNKIPCAFKKVDLKALNGSAIEIETQVIITARE
jgi:hypothetical protein